MTDFNEELCKIGGSGHLKERAILKKVIKMLCQKIALS